MSLGVQGRISTDATPASPLKGGEAVSALSSALAVAAKDLRIELRTREIVTTGGFFAALVAIMASVSFYGGDVAAARVAAGTIWLAVAFASVLALGRTWQREREDSALLALLVSPTPRAAIFAGKAIGVALFITVVEAIVVPVVALMFHIELGRFIGPLSIVLGTSTVGIAAIGTLFGAMTVRTRARDLVLATVLFPLLSPTMVSGVAATREIFVGATFDEIQDYLLLLATFDVVAIAGGLALFGVLLED
jgi:heme exporter protein B